MPRKKTDESPRIADIAKAAGVSIATASNVLAGRRQVHTDAGQRVLDIAEQMGYARTPNKRLRKCIRLVIAKQHGLVVMDTPFFSELIAGIEQACRQKNYELVITYLHLHEDPDALQHVDEILRDDTTPLLLLATEMTSHSLAPFLRAQVPLLVLDSLFLLEEVNTVVMNNYEAGYRATAHLIDNGHRHIGYIGSSILFNNMRDRFSGYANAMKAAGLTHNQDDIFLVEPTMEGASRDMLPLLEARKDRLPTAYFAANDIMAVGAARAMKTLGMRLPQDASMIGMDDMPICQVTNPQLSTMSVPKGAIGHAAVWRLIQMAEQPDNICMKTQIGIELIERDSVMPFQDAFAE